MSRTGRLTLAITFVLLAFAALSAVQTCIAAEFTADVYSRRDTDGAMRFEGKLFVKGEKVRLDVTGNQGMTILTGASGKAVCVDHSRKVYRPIAQTPQITVSDAELRKLAAARTLGSSEVSGYRCEKILYTFKGKTKGTQTRCYSRELGFPLRVERRKGKTVAIVELRNIKRTSVPDSTFAVPGGFKLLKNTCPPPRKVIMATPPKPKL